MPVADQLDRLVDCGVEARRLVAPPRAREQDLEAREVLERLIVQLSGPALALVLRGLDAALQRLVRRALRRRDRGRRGGGERLEQPLVLLRERAVAGRPVERGEIAERAVAEQHRGDQGAPDTEHLSGEAVVRELGEALRSSGPQDGAHDRMVGGETRAPDALDADAGGRRDEQLVAVDERQLRRLGLDQRPRALDHQLEHAVEVGDASERPRDLRGGLEPPHRALQLVAPLAYVAIQARVRDRDRRPIGEDHDRLLVLLRELAPRLLREIEVPPHVAVHHDRHAEERVHRGVGERESVGLRMGADVGEPQRLRVADQDPEEPAPVRQVADRPVGLLVDALRDELLERLAPLVEHADRGVASGGDLLGDVEQAVEEDVRVELGEQRTSDVQQPAKPRVVHAETVSVDTTARARNAIGSGVFPDRPVHHRRRQRRNPTCWMQSLQGRTPACHFTKPSTRTRVSFEAAAWRLGMLPVMLRPDELQLGRGEPLPDTARLTVRDRFGTLEGLTIAYLGDGNNVAHSADAGRGAGRHERDGRVAAGLRARSHDHRARGGGRTPARRLRPRDRRPRGRGAPRMPSIPTCGCRWARTRSGSASSPRSAATRCSGAASRSTPRPSGATSRSRRCSRRGGDDRAAEPGRRRRLEVGGDDQVETEGGRERGRLLLHALEVELLGGAPHLAHLAVELDVECGRLRVGQHDLVPDLAVAAAQGDPPVRVVDLAPRHRTRPVAVAHRAGGWPGGGRRRWHGRQRPHRHAALHERARQVAQRPARAVGPCRSHAGNCTRRSSRCHPDSGPKRARTCPHITNRGRCR
jgi:hypothetical protein